MDNRAIIAIALTSCTLVSGCASRSGHVSVRALEPAGLVNGGSTDHYIATGKRLLAKGSFGLALDQFRAALLADSRSAAAENGLAIAYAKLGRADVAQRHFERAIALEPVNESYRRNLAKLTSPADDGSPALASAGEADTPIALASTDAIVSAPTDSVLSIKTLPLEEAGPVATLQSNGVIALAPGMALLRTRAVESPEAPPALASASSAIPATAQPAANAQPAMANLSLASLFRPTLDRVGLHQYILHTGLAPAEGRKTLAVNDTAAASPQAETPADGLAQFKSAVTRAQHRLAPEQSWAYGCRVTSRGASSNIGLIRVSLTKLNRLFGCSSSS